MKYPHSRSKNSDQQTRLVFFPLNVRAWIGRIFSVFMLGLFICLAYVIYLKLINPKTLPFHVVKINVIYPQPDIQTTLAKTVRAHLQGGFFSLQADQLQQSLMTLPWVQAVSMRRIWPDKLSITVIEKRPLARWNQKGVISQKGKIFFPKPQTIHASWPQFDAEKAYHQQVITMYQRLSVLLFPLHLKLAQLDLSSRLAWTVKLNNNIWIKLGRQNILKRFQNFCALYQKIIGKKAAHVQSVDLRYPDGFAIRWK